MSDTKRRQLIVQPLDGAHPQVGRSLWALEDTRRRTAALLADLAPASVDWLPEWALHSVGTLLYHIAVVEADWLYVEVLGHPADQPYTGDILTLFPYPMRTGNLLTPIIGVGLDEHRQRLATTRQILLDAFRAMRLEEFRRVRVFPEYDVTPEWILHHLCQHEAEHRAEIAALHTQFSKPLSTTRG